MGHKTSRWALLESLRPKYMADVNKLKLHYVPICLNDLAFAAVPSAVLKHCKWRRQCAVATAAQELFEAAFIIIHYIFILLWNLKVPVRIVAPLYRLPDKCRA